MKHFHLEKRDLISRDDTWSCIMDRTPSLRLKYSSRDVGLRVYSCSSNLCCKLDTFNQGSHSEPMLFIVSATKLKRFYAKAYSYEYWLSMEVSYFYEVERFAMWHVNMDVVPFSNTHMRGP